MPHVQRPADGRRRRVDGKDLVAGARPVEPVGAVGVPAGGPFLLEAFEHGFVGNGSRAGRSVGHSGASYRVGTTERNPAVSLGLRLDALDLVANDAFGHFEHAGVSHVADDRVGQPLDHPARDGVDLLV